MEMKMQDNIRKVEIISFIIASIIRENNIDINLDNETIETIYDIAGTIYYIDVITAGYTQRITKEYKELKEMYDEIIKNTSSMLKELNVSDPTTLFALYVYLYRSGYLSYNHLFKYSNNMKDFPLLQGIDVVRGTGVCRSISSFFTDLCIEQGLNASNISVNTTSATCRGLQKMSPIELAEDKQSQKFVKTVSTLTKLIPLPNHLITLVEDNEMCYIFDPTNDGYLLPTAKNRLIVPSNPELSMTYRSRMQSIQRLYGIMELQSNRRIQKVLKLPSISEEVFSSKYIEALKLCKNQLLFEKLYQDNYELYKGIYEISEEQKDLIRRLIPIIPDANKLKRKI